jgi:hypothetical protein
VKLLALSKPKRGAPVSSGWSACRKGPALLRGKGRARVEACAEPRVARFNLSLPKNASGFLAERREVRRRPRQENMAVALGVAPRIVYRIIRKQFC